MKIEDCIFHFNDKKALDDQSEETSKNVKKHFWGSLHENQLAKEFVAKDVFGIQDSYHSILFYPTYAAAILLKKVDSLDVFVRCVGLDGWNAKIHASSCGRERYAVPNLQAPTVMDQGLFPIHQIEELKVALEESLSESECNRGAKRRKLANHEGNQKTPSFLNEKLGQSIRSVISKEKTDLDENTNANGHSTESAYGGTTDVGMHTGAKKRNTAAPLVFSVISVMLRFAGRRESDFHTLMAIYLSSFLDELPKVKVYDARAMDRFIIVMREAQPFVQSLKDKKLHQRILQNMKTHHYNLYKVPYVPPQPPFKQRDVSKILNGLRSPEFPKPPALQLVQESEDRLQRSRREARKNLCFIDMKSKTFSGSLQEAWVQLHGLNARFWKAASTLNNASTSDCVEILKADFERFSSIASVALESANEGRYTMSTVIRSYELLAGTICFCFAHREMEVNHGWFSNYIPAFDPKNLDHLVLDDKRAIDATDQVRHFLEIRADGQWSPFRNHEHTMHLAKEFASKQSPGSKRNRKVHQDFLKDAKQQIDKRWQKISEQQAKLSKLDLELIQAKKALTQSKANLSSIKSQQQYFSDPNYQEAVTSVKHANAHVSRVQKEIRSLEAKPKNLVFALPEESEAESLLFFMYMDKDALHLAELAHRAECLLWHVDQIPNSTVEGQPLDSWLDCSIGFLKNERKLSQGMIRLFCTKNESSSLAPDIRKYERRTGIVFPKLGHFALQWERKSPFEHRGESTTRLFTEKIDPTFTSQPIVEFLEKFFLVAIFSPCRENMALATPDMKPSWLTREQYNAFANLRSAGRTQIRSLLNVLFENLLPLGNTCVQVIIQQVVFQVGSGDWKTDLEDGLNGLQAMEVFWSREVEKLREAPKSYERLLLAGVISGFYGQFHEPLQEIAVEAADTFFQWASTTLLEAGSTELIEKQARFYGFAILCLASVKMTFQVRCKLLRLLVLYRDRLLLSKSSADSSLEQAVMKVMGTKWPCPSDAACMKVKDQLLTSLVKNVVECAPSGLKWSEVQYDIAESTACHEAESDGQLFSINLNNGIILVNGKPKSFLPQSIISNSLFVRHFGKASPEVSIGEGLNHYRTTHGIQGFFFYDFVIDASDQLHIFEFDSRKGFGESERLELLDPANAPFQPYLIEERSFWLNARQQYLLLRDKPIQNRRISFAMKPGKLLSVTPAFHDKTVQEIFQNEDQFEKVRSGSTPFIKLLKKKKFEEMRFVVVTVNHSQAIIKYLLPRYGLCFTQDDKEIRSDDFKGYALSPDQQFLDTLPGFTTFLLLSNSEGERIVLVPCGEVLRSGELRLQQDADSKIALHKFRVHRRFGYLHSSNTLSRLHLACLYASTGCLVPDRTTGKTGVAVAADLLRQCFQNYCFSNEELAKLRNLSKHSEHSCTLRLLVWCTYRWSRSLQRAYDRTVGQDDLVELDRFASQEYGASTSGPYLTSIERQSVFSVKEPVEDSTEGSIDTDTATSLDESDISQYIRKIEKEDFQHFLSSQVRDCAPELPLAMEMVGGRIRERVVADLRKSYHIYSKLNVKSVDCHNFDVSEIHQIHEEVTQKRQSREESILRDLEGALSSKNCFDFFAGSMRKYVSSDLLHMIFSNHLLQQLQTTEKTNEWAEEIQSRIFDWALLCVFEDKLSRLNYLSEQRNQEELVRELECTREWNPRQYPRWLAFEVEQQLQIRPEQFKTVIRLLQKPSGSMIQLNMGSGKTRVMVPMLVLELSRQRGKLVRINVLPSILQEALLFYQQCLVASVQHTKLFTLPFVRENDLDEYKVKILDEELRRCHMHGGCLIVTPQHRNSLLLKQHECDVHLNDLSEEDIVDVLDESDAILEPSFQLVYAMGTKQDLPSLENRCSVFQRLLTILSREESDLVANPQAFFKEDKEAGSFSNLRVLDLSSNDRTRLVRNLAGHFVKNPSSGFEWLEKVNRKQDQELLFKIIADPQYQDTEKTIRRNPLFEKFENDILAARGFLACGILVHCLEARYGVAYGLRHPKKGLQDPDTRLAVPYSASDTPKARAEFSHPDIAIGYTNLSYLHEGLNRPQFQRALDVLDEKGLSVKLSTYGAWIKSIRNDVPPEELVRFDTYEKVDPSNSAQFKLMHSRLKRCMEVVFFWLNEVVFPVDTMQYPQRLVSSAWNLADSKYVIGFSGTDDNRFLLPAQVKQIQHTDEALRATNGKMIDLVLSCTKEICQIDNGQLPFWETVLDKCFQNSTMQALIDIGGLMAGCIMKDVISYAAKKLRSVECDLEGFVYYSTEFERWEVFEVATGRTQSIGRSSLSAYDCFVFFDESRCRGTDFKLREKSSALVTLDSRLTKDKFLQGCARMRQLSPGGQSLIFAGTREIVTQMSTASSLVSRIVENGINAVERGLQTYVQRARDFDSFPTPTQDDFGLKEMYSKGIPHNQSIDQYLDNVQEIAEMNMGGELLDDAIDYARSIGSGVEVSSGVGVEECEKEVHAESEQEQQQEVEVTSEHPRVQKDWQYNMVFKVNSLKRLFRSQFFSLSKLTKKYKIAEMSTIQWSETVYCTKNFWETIEDVKVKESSSLSPFLRLVDPLLVFPDGKVVLISLYELDKLLPLWWELTEQPSVSIDHVFRLASACPMLGEWSALPVSVETLTSLKLFRGDVKYSEEERVILRSMLKDLPSPVDTVKKLLSTRSRLGHYEQSDLALEASLLALPTNGTRHQRRRLQRHEYFKNLKLPVPEYSMTMGAKETSAMLRRRLTPSSYIGVINVLQRGAYIASFGAERVEDVDETDAFLAQLASISGDEVAFNMAEAERADKVRQMQEWGFDEKTIANTFDVAMDDTLELDGMIEGMKEFVQEGYVDDDVDWNTVESHTMVEKDPDTGDPIRQQMVYVDEITCIGCTNCAMIAQSTFFMEDEYGRARVFNQWGDDEETIAIAIETCPVDCIHYVPYDELVRLEKDRRGLNINFKARLVGNENEAGRVGSAVKFSERQKISGNSGIRCNNCPSRGCKNCPMFGVGKNPVFEKKEKERKLKAERRRLQQMREEDEKTAEL